VRLIFVNRVYWPEEPATAQLLTDLAEALAAAGHEVSVICRRPAGTPRREVRDGVSIRRVSRAHRRGYWNRPIDYLGFLVGAWGVLMLESAPGTRVIALTDPPLLGTLLWKIIRYSGARLIQWCQDIYPEVLPAVAPGAGADLVCRFWKPWRNFAWRHSQQLVALGPEMADLIRSQGVRPDRVALIPNWAPRGVERADPVKVAALRSEWELEGKFVLCYSGNLGRVHDLDPLLDLAAALQPDPAIVLLLIGDGAQRSQLQAAAKSRALANVQFRPAQPRSRLRAVLALGDLQLVTLLPTATAVVYPSKFYGILAAGRPVLYVGPTNFEIARLVERHGLGLAGTRDEIPRLAEAVREAARQPDISAHWSAAAIALARDTAGFEHALVRWQALLERDAACRAS